MMNIYGRESNKNKVLEILSINPDISAKKIYNQLKSKYGINITYQGVHKLLNELVEDKVLEKNEREYKINLPWLDNIQLHSSNLRKKVINFKSSNLNTKNISISPKEFIISYDQTGSIFNNSFDELLWRKKIPEHYAKRHNISLEEAHEIVLKRYRDAWDSTGSEWRNPIYWIKLFDLKSSFEEIVNELKDHIKPYDDALIVIKRLSKKYKLILISNAHKILLDHKLKISGIRKYFSAVYSICSDFNMMEPNENIFKEICANLNIKPSQLIHIGNKLKEDYQIPSSYGVHSFLIDRSGRHKEYYMIRDLFEFEEKIKELELKND